MYKRYSGAVILGHNKDDTIENIFSNIIKKNSYHNLLGMSIHSKEQDVNIFRPLLNIPKDRIIKFAKDFNIPYTYDSTPEWSRRGKMRDVLIPKINQFDHLIIDGMLELANNLSEIYSVYNKCLPKIIYYESYCEVEDKDIYFYDYWKNILTQICKYYKMYNLIKNKSIIHFIENIKFGNRITLNKNIVCIKINNSINFILSNQ